MRPAKEVAQEIVNNAAGDGDLASLKKGADAEFFPTTEAMDLAAENGHLDVLLWGQEYNCRPSSEGISRAAKNNRFDILECFLDRKNLINKPVFDAIENDRFDFVEWWISHNYMINASILDMAAGLGKLKALKMWYEKGRPVIMLAIEHDNKSRAEHGEDPIEFDEADLYPSDEGADNAAEGGHLNVLKWLKGFGVFPSEDALNWAAAHGHLNVLKWCASLDPKLLPSDEAFGYMDIDECEGAYPAIIEWMKSQGVVNPDG